MSLFDPAHQILELGLMGSSQRAKALSANLANINTPGYRRVDLDFHSQLSGALRAQQASGAQHVPVPGFGVSVDGAAAVRPDGNSVDVDQEGASIAQNALEFQAMTTLLGLRRRNLETVMRTTG